MEDPTGCRELLARMQQSIPFNDKNKFVNFMELFCRVKIFRKLLCEPAKVQECVFDQIFTGKIEYTVWEKIINMLEDSHVNKLVKSMVSGNMEAYGLPHVTFPPLQDFINTWLKTGGDDGQPHPIVKQHGWHYYDLKVYVQNIDENTFELTVKMEMTPYANNEIMHDLVNLGMDFNAPYQPDDIMMERHEQKLERQEQKNEDNQLNMTEIDRQLAEQEILFGIKDLRDKGIEVILSDDNEDISEIEDVD
jgi:hypothetical protein